MENYNQEKLGNEIGEHSPSSRELIESEINLRRQIEEVAAESHALPREGKIMEDYVFEEKDAEGNTRQVMLSDLFEEGKNSLMIYSLKFSDKGKPLYEGCNSIADGINRMVFYAEQRVKIVIVGNISIDKLNEWAKMNGWDNLNLLSSAKNKYNSKYHGDNKKRNQLPILNVFRKTEDGIYHFYATELLFAPKEKELKKSDADTIWPLWNLFDLIPDELGANWNSKLSYR